MDPHLVGYQLFIVLVIVKLMGGRGKFSYLVVERGVLRAVTGWTSVLNVLKNHVRLWMSRDMGLLCCLGTHYG